MRGFLSVEVNCLKGKRVRSHAFLSGEDKARWLEPMCSQCPAPLDRQKDSVTGYTLSCIRESVSTLYPLKNLHTHTRTHTHTPLWFTLYATVTSSPAAIVTYKLPLSPIIQFSERVWNLVTCFSSCYHDDLILHTTRRQCTMCRHCEMLAVNLTSNFLNSDGCH